MKRVIGIIRKERIQDMIIVSSGEIKAQWRKAKAFQESVGFTFNFVAF